MSSQKEVPGTKEEMQSWLDTEFGETEYRILGPFYEAHRSFQLIHIPCGTRFSRNISELKKGLTCPCCMNGKAFLKSEDYKEALLESCGEETAILEAFQGRDIPIRFRHQCGFEFYLTPSEFMAQKEPCPQCRKRKLEIQNEEIRKTIYDRYGSRFGILNFLVDRYQPVEIFDTLSKERIRIPYKSLMADDAEDRIKKILASKERNKKDRSEIAEFKVPLNRDERTKSYVLSLYKKSIDFDVLSPYLGDRVKMKFRHKGCSCIFKADPKSFLESPQCPNCTESSQSVEFRRYLKDSEPDYKLLETYKGSKVEVRFRHLKCNRSFTCKPAAFKRGIRCPYCDEE